MEEGQKKIIMIVVIVACIVAAVIITVATRSGSSVGGPEPIKRGEAMFWMKCRNPKCENTWQMDKRDYLDYLEKHQVGMAIPPIVCPKCGEESGYQAEKCGKCGFIFELGSVPNDVKDRCPKCSYSASEEVRKKARGE